MVRAILDGRKTKTRRVMKPQPNPIPRGAAKPGEVYTSGWFEESNVPRYVLDRCPYGKPGDRLYVRETWRPESWSATEDWGWVEYPDGSKIEVENTGKLFNQVFPHGRDVKRWRPSIHMPRWASRITLEITDIRVERLNEISEEDAIAEGITKQDAEYHWYDGPQPVWAFKTLWESIHGPGSWDANPWVWVVEFKPMWIQLGDHWTPSETNAR
jgi:hypothetical protein